MRVEIEPEQQPEVVAAVARLLSRPTSDPWWRAGLEEALGGDGSAAEHAWSGPGIVEA